MWLVEAPWHACRHGAGRGASKRRPQASQANGRPLSGHWCRCVEQQPAGGLLALEPMPTFGKGLDLRRAAEEAFEVKDVLNSTLDSEALKQTLYRQAKNQVGTRRARPSRLPLAERQGSHPMPAWGAPGTHWPSHALCIS